MNGNGCDNGNGGVTVKMRGFCDYRKTLEEMRAFTDARGENDCDELWLLQHPPVYTLGQGANMRDVLQSNGVPVVRADRGGRATYHGPGQAVAYILLDLRRRKMGPRELARRLESAAAGLLAEHGIAAAGDIKAPGVYARGKKIASLGLRVRRGCCYHGLSLNVAMDLSPFDGINVCGFPKLQCTQMADFGFSGGAESVMHDLANHLRASLEKGAQP